MRVEVKREGQGAERLASSGEAAGRSGGDDGNLAKTSSPPMSHASACKLLSVASRALPARCSSKGPRCVSPG